MATNNATNTSDPITVGQGGTGVASTTAYSVLCGGTTSTAALQSVASVGTSGQVLTSNGAGALPTWGTASSFNPASTVTLYDDFIGYGIGTVGTVDLVSTCSWDALGNGVGASTTTLNGHPGVLALGSNFVSGHRGIALSAAGNFGGFIVGGGAITINWIVNTATLSNSTNRYTARLGITDGTIAVANGLYFSYIDNVNSGKWQCNAVSASSAATPISTSVAAATSYKNFQITINAGGTSVEFFIDGSSQGSITTNIPSVAINPSYSVSQSAGTINTSSVLLDAFYLSQTLTTPR